MKDLIRIIVRFAVVGLLLVGVYALFYATPSSQVEASDEVIRVATNNYPPFVYVGADNEGLKGFDVAIMREIGKRLNKEVTFTIMAFESQIIALKQGKVDAVIGGIDITPSRSEQVAMIPYYGEKMTTLSLLFWDQVPHGVKTLDDLHEQKKPVSVSTLSGSPLLDYLDKAHPAIRAKSYGDIDEIILEIRYGKADAALLDTHTCLKLAKDHQNLKVVTFEIASEYQFEGQGISVAKENAKLSAKITQAVNQMKKDGTIKRLENSWMR